MNVAELLKKYPAPWAARAQLVDDGLYDYEIRCANGVVVANVLEEADTAQAICEMANEAALLASQVESMAMRIESLAEELAKPEDVRLREVIGALDGRAVIFDGLGERVGHLLDEMDEWIERAGEAERLVEDARRSLSSVAEAMTEHAYQELASALESPPRIAGKTADFDPPGREYTVGDALGLRRDR